MQMTSPPPHFPHVLGQFSETFSIAHLLIEFCEAQLHHFIELIGGPTRNLKALSSHEPEPSSSGIMVVVGATVGGVPEGSHIPHVTGQFTRTSEFLEHLPQVLLLPAQSQDLLLLSDSI